MKVTKTRLIDGIVDYIENEVVPKVDDKSTQIMLSVGAKMVKANPKLAEGIFENTIVKTLLAKDGNEYEIDGLFNAIDESIRLYGAFPVTIPPIPILSASEKTLSFSETDAAEIKRSIERAKG